VQFEIPIAVNMNIISPGIWHKVLKFQRSLLPWYLASRLHNVAFESNNFIL